MSVSCVSAKLGSLQVISSRLSLSALPEAGLPRAVTSVLRVQHARHEHPRVGGWLSFLNQSPFHSFTSN